MFTRLRSWVLPCGLLIVTACSNVLNLAPYSVSSDKPVDWRWSNRGYLWELSVPSEPGIGRIMLKPQALSPSPNLVVHLPLPALEQVTVSYDDRQLMAGFARSGFIHESRCPSCSDPQLDALTLTVIERSDRNGQPDGYDLYLPGDYWRTSRGQVKISWVDYFRS